MDPSHSPIDRRHSSTPLPGRNASPPPCRPAFFSPANSLLLVRFVLAILVIATENAGFFHTSLAAAIGMLLIDASERPTPGERFARMASECLFVMGVLAILVYRSHVPVTLLTAAAVAFLIRAIRVLALAKATSPSFGRHVAPLCLIYLVALFTIRVRLTALYIAFLTYTVPFVIALLGAATLESIVDLFIDFCIGPAATRPDNDS